MLTHKAGKIAFLRAKRLRKRESLPILETLNTATWLHEYRLGIGRIYFEWPANRVRKLLEVRADGYCLHRGGWYKCDERSKNMAKCRVIRSNNTLCFPARGITYTDIKTALLASSDGAKVELRYGLYTDNLQTLKWIFYGTQAESRQGQCEACSNIGPVVSHHWYTPKTRQERRRLICYSCNAKLIPSNFGNKESHILPSWSKQLEVIRH